MESTSRIKGKVTASVFRFPKGMEKELLGLRDKLVAENKKLELAVFNLRYRKQVAVNHNIVTNEGDALIADLMSNTPARTKITASTGYIPVGTGWTGTTPKNNGWVNTITGTAKALEAGYPMLKGTWGNTDDNVTQYRVIYAAGSFGTVTINEAAITSHSTDVAANSCLAYAQVTPSVSITASDTLQIDWELTFLGA